MAKRARRTFTPQLKAEVVLAILSGRQTMAEICRQQSLKPELVSIWKKTMLSRLPGVFEGPTHDGGAQARVADLERLVGQLTMELAVAKKSRACSPHRSATAGDRDRTARGVFTTPDRPRDRLAREQPVPRITWPGRCREARRGPSPTGWAMADRWLLSNHCDFALVGPAAYREAGV